MRKYFALLLFLFGCQKIETSFQAGKASSELNSTMRGKPNIILIIGDDVGYELLTCNGGQSYETPNLDRMASEGLRFTYCNGAPVCSPARFMLLTGKYNFRNYNHWSSMDTSNRTVGNMLRDAGYSTCYVGKWQLDGYDPSIRALGFDKYSIWQPGKVADAGSRYKNPHIYQDGAFIPDSMTLNKYADDWFTDYMLHFMDTASKPYFVYYSMSLSHIPFSPTPDDRQFANWDPDNESAPRFFPSMVKYMDKKVGQIFDSVKTRKNTIIIYVGDNGTPSDITSVWNGDSIVGGKGETTVWGTHVPLIIYHKGVVPGIDTSLVDFTDFMPTLASIAKIPLPTDYGILDGKSFYPQPSKRDWIYCFYQPNPNTSNDGIATWVNDRVYKRYGAEDTLGYKKNQLFNIALDPYETRPIPDKKKTPYERYIDSSFKKVLHSLYN
jgi:arylsulfatase A